MVIKCHELKGKDQHPAFSKCNSQIVILGKEMKNMYAKEIKFSTILKKTAIV